MSVVLFDTHAFVKRLTAVGMPEAQAEVLADEQARLIDDRLATKTDIAGLAAAVESLAAKLEGFATKSDLEPLATVASVREAELRLEAKTEAAKAELVKWVFGAVILQTLVVVGAVFALARSLH